MKKFIIGKKIGMTRIFDDEGRQIPVTLVEAGVNVISAIKTVEKDGYLNPIRGKAYDHFIKKGILLRPLGNTLYILPPYCIKPSELAMIYLEIENFASTIN